jgi:hypothetical protein
MTLVYHTVRWLNQHGGQAGWAYSRGLGKQPAWGFDNLGKFGWMRTATHGTHTFFVAPNGCHFSSMRELFASFRLGMCDCERETDQLEVLRHVLKLVTLEIHATDFPGFIVRGFGGNRAFAEHYIHWLESERLAKCLQGDLRSLELDDEGHAVARMLDMTAPGTNVDLSPLGAIRRFDALFPNRRG